jgi:ribosomal protein S1
MINKGLKLVSFFAAILVLSVIVSACKITYKFNGASIAPSVKTVFIDYFTNRARVVNPNLSQTFTEKMKDKFVSETGLSMAKDQGDLEFSGEITGYEVRAMSVQQSDAGKDYASMNRLTVTVKVVFTNNKDHEQDFNTSFSAYYDWDSTKSLSQVENDAVDSIVEQLIEDIFNKSVANW